MYRHAQAVYRTYITYAAIEFDLNTWNHPSFVLAQKSYNDVSSMYYGFKYKYDTVWADLQGGAAQVESR